MDEGWVFVILFTLLAIIGALFLQTEYREEIVKHGCAVYDSQTAKFTWKEKPK